jgi:anthranilate synthase/aminodeoxychorismate synthase-like glutamine amidotransferase
MILVIDNYDSFTFNLVQLIGALGGEPVVQRNDQITLDEIAELAPERIVISPGPCTPDEAGISVDCVRRFGPTTPILGVCLGHQSIGRAYGGRIVRARRVMHGKVSRVEHTEDPLFNEVPNPIEVARYHSLVIEPESLPAELNVTAHTAEAGFTDEIQAVKHREFPVWGVQFHPESIASQAGRQIVENFLRMG